MYVFPGSYPCHFHDQQQALGHAHIQNQSVRETFLADAPPAIRGLANSHP